MFKAKQETSKDFKKLKYFFLVNRKYQTNNLLKRMTTMMRTNTGRTMSKIEQALQKEEREREQVIKQQKRNAYQARLEARNKRAVPEWVKLRDEQLKSDKLKATQTGDFVIVASKKGHRAPTKPTCGFVVRQEDRLTNQFGAFLLEEEAHEAQMRAEEEKMELQNKLHDEAFPNTLGSSLFEPKLTGWAAIAGKPKPVEELKPVQPDELAASIFDRKPSKGICWADMCEDDSDDDM